MSNPQIINSTNPDKYKVLDYNGVNMGYRTDILDAIAARMEDGLKRYAQILTVPLVIRYPESVQAELSSHWTATRDPARHYRSNPCFNYFLAVYRKALNAKRQHLIHYVWSMERHYSANPHYHLILFLNGNLMRYFAIPPVEVTEIWRRSLACFHNYPGTGLGLIHVSAGSYCNMPMKHGYLLHRGDADMLQYVLQHYSYIAKINTKINEPHVRCFGASKLKQEKNHEL